MDGIGVGPSGPPVPPSTVFSVVSFPTDRGIVFNDETNELFKFVTPADEALIAEEKSKSDVVEVEKPADKKVRQPKYRFR